VGHKAKRPIAIKPTENKARAVTGIPASRPQEVLRASATCELSENNCEKCDISDLLQMPNQRLCNLLV
jgi:hypothetical protein